MPNLQNIFSFQQRIQWQTVSTIWKSLHKKEVLPFLFRFLLERIRQSRSPFWNDWKRNHKGQRGFISPLSLVAFYIAYKDTTSSERALFLLLKILKQQSSEVFFEAIGLFRQFGIDLR
ncbi:hypothetical protein LEP1GSC202_2841 [Leptospira yanagawae serovar Saopaulo str. Sao Paulo = ATCC 700523]|uniref:Uncharacterized protein n=2 Tax=Leptospira yanagawae TaxID=293069 RepID=A0ABY2LZW8_9LEPT|nr:hypothetical protein [Leptospira yanagawae]EOQ88645.1 hypothetical protein LEP1GSC202_2841 [Leptospira yanagawae serovar Saopaulo str. Sao Paulo = ATCC 700523]TGL19898.1 hypothetical protein EHQ46_10905 [Leptospira yanagawae]